eukprot:scaffold130051_cov63-Phaeocystis_antarctica.AAC.3
MLIRRHLPVGLVVGDVEGVLHGGDVRRLRELLLETLPVGLAEEGVTLDLGHAELHAAESLRGLGDEQCLDELICIAREVAGLGARCALLARRALLNRGQHAAQRLLVGLHRIEGVDEGGFAHDHLVA